jgi:tetratricopeptide (TPR) repeat protein
MPTAETFTQLSDAIKANPTDANVYLERGKALVTARRYTKSLKDLKKAVELDPKNAMAFYYRGYAYAQLANYKRAIEETSRAIELNSELINAYNARGFSYRRRGEFQPALKDFDTAIDLYADNSDLYVERALARAGLRNWDEARSDFERAIEILNRNIENPANAICSAHYYADRGWTKVYLGKGAEAENDLILAKEIDSQNEIIYFYLGQIYLNRNEYKYAVDALTQAATLEPEHAEIYLIRARAFDALKEKEKAAADRKRFEELSNPKDALTPAKPKK